MSFILATNDDGVHSPGLAALADAIAELTEVVVVAPDRNRSAIGHALTLDSPLRAEPLRQGVFAVDGTPTDCVNLAVHGLIQQKPQMVVSGINRGANLGDDISYSGTVCAAKEASLMGYPALAFSLDARDFSADDLIRASRFARDLVRHVFVTGLPPGIFLNINFPSGPFAGCELTRQGKRHYGEGIVTKTDPRGRNYYWVGGGAVGFEDIPGSDCNAMRASKVSITPLKTGMTCETALKTFSSWDLTAIMS